jgi:hypothetical protein
MSGGMKNRHDDDDLAFDRKVDAGESSSERSSYARTQFLISLRALKDSVIRRSKLFKEVQSEPGFFTLIPIEASFDIGVDSGFGFDSVALHFDF